MFTTLVLMTGITAAIPYGFSALAQLKWRLVDHRTMETPRFVRDMVVAALSLVFSILFIWYSRNTGNSFWVYWAPFLLAAGALAARHPRLPGPAQAPDAGTSGAAVPVTRHGTASSERGGGDDDNPGDRRT